MTKFKFGDKVTIIDNDNKDKKIYWRNSRNKRN